MKIGSFLSRFANDDLDEPTTGYKREGEPEHYTLVYRKPVRSRSVTETDLHCGSSTTTAIKVTHHPFTK